MLRVDASAMRADLAKLAAEIPTTAHEAFREAAETAYESAKTTTSFKDRGTGRRSLRGSIRFGARGQMNFYVRADAPHALFVEEDTQPHEIRPRRVGSVSSRRHGGGPALLRFKIGGRWVSTPLVRHPGTTGKHFMRDARDLGERALVEMLETRLGALIGR